YILPFSRYVLKLTLMTYGQALDTDDEVIATASDEDVGGINEMYLDIVRPYGYPVYRRHGEQSHRIYYKIYLYAMNSIQQKNTKAYHIYNRYIDLLTWSPKKYIFFKIQKYQKKDIDDGAYYFGCDKQATTKGIIG
ncbi:hypothetical protein ACJX0J_023543, partial [Zea mays]